MFRKANKVSRPDKALILGFMAGLRENPRPNSENVIVIKLYESEVSDFCFVKIIFNMDTCIHNYIVRECHVMQSQLFYILYWHRFSIELTVTAQFFNRIFRFKQG